MNFSNNNFWDQRKNMWQLMYEWDADDTFKDIDEINCIKIKHHTINENKPRENIEIFVNSCVEIINKENNVNLFNKYLPLDFPATDEELAEKDAVKNGMYIENRVGKFFDNFFSDNGTKNFSPYEVVSLFAEINNTKNLNLMINKENENIYYKNEKNNGEVNSNKLLKNILKVIVCGEIFNYQNNLKTYFKRKNVLDKRTIKNFRQNENDFENER